MTQFSSRLTPKSPTSSGTYLSSLSPNPLSAPYHPQPPIPHPPHPTLHPLRPSSLPASSILHALYHLIHTHLNPIYPIHLGLYQYQYPYPSIRTTYPPICIQIRKAKQSVPNKAHRSATTPFPPARLPSHYQKTSDISFDEDETEDKKGILTGKAWPRWSIRNGLPIRSNNQHY